MISVLSHSLMITAFVAAMMISVEYVNVQTQGALKDILGARPGTKYIVAALLGALPGCLGTFITATLYLHGTVSLGAMVTTMIVTSGDESFVMLALIPGSYLFLTGLLILVGVAAGWLTDRFLRHRLEPLLCRDLVTHEDTACRCFPRGHIVEQLRRIQLSRLVLVLALGGFLAALAVGVVGPSDWNWIRVSLMGVTLFGLFITLTVPDHFLVEHLWTHVVLGHVPRIFLWTFGVMAGLHLLGQVVNIESLVSENRWSVLVVALLLGIIPESGPHLLFVTLYSQGALPLGVLVANSAVQDGHGMLPLLAHSRKVFLQVKVINLLVGLLLGVTFLALSPF